MRAIVKAWYAVLYRIRMWRLRRSVRRVIADYEKGLNYMSDTIKGRHE